MEGVTKEVVVEPVLRSFSELLWEWASITERMVRDWRTANHVPWWYNERASLSPLAGAIWRMGGIAFEEFSAKKTTPTRDQNSDATKWRGRIDLQFTYRGEDYVAEAKQAWPKIGSRATSAQGEISDALQRAVKDAQAVGGKWGQKLAIVFASPRFPESQFARERELLKNWRRIVGDVKCEGKAFFWMRDCQKIVDRGEIYPGSSVFIRQV